MMLIADAMFGVQCYLSHSGVMSLLCYIYRNIIQNAIKMLSKILCTIINQIRAYLSNIQSLYRCLVEWNLHHIYSVLRWIIYRKNTSLTVTHTPISLYLCIPYIINPVTTQYSLAQSDILSYSVYGTTCYNEFIYLITHTLCTLGASLIVYAVSHW